MFLQGRNDVRGIAGRRCSRILPVVHSSALSPGDFVAAMLTGAEPPDIRDVQERFSETFLDAVPIERLLATVDETRRGLGPAARLEGAQTDGRRTTFALVGEATGFFVSLTVDSDQSQKLSGLHVEPLSDDAVRWSDFSAGREVPAAELNLIGSRAHSHVSDVLRTVGEADCLVGAGIAIARDGQTLYAASVGRPSIKTDGVPTLRTRWRAGSIAKTVTGLAVLELQARGQLDLDTNISEYLTSIRVDPLSGHPEPTLRHLLAHTAGLRRSVHPRAGSERRSLREWLSDGVAVTSPPGKVPEYSNLGYGLVGLIVEDVTGRPYADVVTDLVFGPAGMVDSEISSEPSEALANAASGYVVKSGWLVPARPQFVPDLAAGGLICTISDLVHLGHYLLDQPAAWEPQTRVGAPDEGVGISLTDLRGSLAGWHNGGLDGWKAMLLVRPNDRTVIAAQANGYPAQLEALCTKVLEITDDATS